MWSESSSLTLSLPFFLHSADLISLSNADCALDSRFSQSVDVVVVYSNFWWRTFTKKKNELEEKQQHTVSNNRMSSKLREKMYIMTLMMSHKESKSSVVVVVVLRKSARKWEKSILPLTPPASSYECYNPLPHFASFIICIRTSICFVLCLSLPLSYVKLISNFSWPFFSLFLNHQQLPTLHNSFIRCFTSCASSRCFGRSSLAFAAAACVTHARERLKLLSNGIILSI